MDIIFKSWDSILRIFITILFTYPGLIILLRITGKRSLSKLNMFDFIVTVALGSTLASSIISANVTVIDALITLGVLLIAQFIISWTSVHWWSFNKLIKSEPTLLFFDGEFLEDAMQSARVVREEILAEIRQAGISDLNDVYAVVLETNGILSVLKCTDSIERSTLTSVRNYEPEDSKSIDMRV